MFKRALVSTSNKEGLIDFLRPLVASGMQVVSTGGTSQYLKKNGINVTEVFEVTGFPEMMDGRVRTLHPYIHMGLLARSFVPEDFEILKKHKVEPFDLVVVNLYPFEEAYKKNLKGHELIEQIDIGGPSLLRAAAKSFERITVVCDPSDYAEILNRHNKKSIDEAFNKKLATKVFSHCSSYDALISKALSDEPLSQELPLQLDLKLSLKQNLRYGENPHQKAALFENLTHPLSLQKAEQIQGKELSYNNILDLEAAVSVLCEFKKATSVIVKHNTPCGVATADKILNAYEKAFKGDPISAFGGIVALNKKVTKELAVKMIEPFLECIIAPDFEVEALEVFKTKKNLRVLKLKSLENCYNQSRDLDIKLVRGGALVQTADNLIEWDESWKIFAPYELKVHLREDLVFAMKVAKYVKSNAIVIAANSQTIGICGGQTNRVDSVKMALKRAKQFGADFSSWVLASDAFFPFRDSVDIAATFPVKWIIQPGGSLKDADVELAAVEHKIGMVITGQRHFKH
ncbi:MAG: bifunctional phosphoribosylaminoimidazolecarboxamide formyltransferase/IMP cyclohydrolase [Oligoflexia bacterium]|nr:bifunctional phosphoribosylaminoimidazolecarboxamide formyltransferase/IMP cyclohydrolase [Oligoflexia bacterium]